MKIPPNPRRNFLSRALTVAGAAALGTAAMFPRRARAAMGLAGAKLSGNTTLPYAAVLSAQTGASIEVKASASLVIRNGATITAEPGALINGFNVGGGALTPQFALFEIPLGIYGAVWTEFELKGSINNFNGATGNGPALIYFYGSQYAGTTNGNGHGGAQLGITANVYYTTNTGDHTADRAWRIQPTYLSITQASAVFGGVGTNAVIVCVPIYGNPEIRPNNPNLRFIYQRVSATFMEEKWMPILPRWSAVMP
jgi:hypothetical protein